MNILMVLYKIKDYIILEIFLLSINLFFIKKTILQKN